MHVTPDVCEGSGVLPKSYASIRLPASLREVEWALHHGRGQYGTVDIAIPHWMERFVYVRRRHLGRAWHSPGITWEPYSQRCHQHLWAGRDRKACPTLLH